MFSSDLQQIEPITPKLIVCHLIYCQLKPIKQSVTVGSYPCVQPLGVISWRLQKGAAYNQPHIWLSVERIIYFSRWATGCATEIISVSIADPQSDLELSEWTPDFCLRLRSHFHITRVWWKASVVMFVCLRVPVHEDITLEFKGLFSFRLFQSSPHFFYSTLSYKNSGYVQRQLLIKIHNKQTFVCVSIVFLFYNAVLVLYIC